MRTRFLIRITAVCLLAATGSAQTTSQSFLQSTSSPLGRGQKGWSIYNITGSFGYSTLALPVDQLAFSLQRLESDYDGTASASFGYNYKGEKGAVSLLYSPSLVGRVRYSDLNAFNQSLNLTASRQIAPRWDLSVSVAGSDTSLDQALFTPAILSGSTTPVATLDDLIRASSGGQYTSDQLASFLTGTPYVVTPSRSLVFGTKYFTTGLNTSLKHRYSPRLSFEVSLGASRTQTRNNSRQDLQGQLNFLIPRMTSEQAGVSMDYSWSPRTQIGVRGTASQIDSTLGRYIVGNTRLFVSRKLTPHWFASVSAGPAFLEVLRLGIFAGFRQPSGLGYAADGNVGYTMGDHSLMASYTRSVGDTFGFQSASSDSAGGSWQWAPAGRLWVLYASGGLQRLRGGVLGDVQFAQANVGLARYLNRQFSVNFTYGYVDRRTGGAAAAGILQQNLNGFSTRVTLVWSPEGQLERQASRKAAGDTGAGGNREPSR
ncbi:MAG: hypothetical protein IANPNBLG_04149 [Bryobacteraceae bacterium]|nr:hypothetical protein [Bryobacteraceae bacterium]